MTKLNVHGIIPVTRVNGPGNRFGVWVQGCPRRCAGCQNPTALRFDVKVKDGWPRLLEPSEIMDMIPEGVEGFTFSGGEPLHPLHVPGFTELARLGRAIGLSVLIYSGYKYNEVKHRCDELLSLTDILIDDIYDASQPATDGWRGSANQTVHFLSDRYKEFAKNLPPNAVEFYVENGSVKVTGFPSNELRRVIGKYKRSEQE